MAQLMIVGWDLHPPGRAQLQLGILQHLMCLSVTRAILLELMLLGWCEGL